MQRSDDATSQVNACTSVGKMVEHKVVLTARVAQFVMEQGEALSVRLLCAARGSYIIVFPFFSFEQAFLITFRSPVANQPQPKHICQLCTPPS